MKKTLLIVVIMALIIGLCAGVASAKSDNGNGQGQEMLLQSQTQGFTDVEGHWAAWAIKKANAKGLMVGMGNNYFGAEELLTKAQVLVLLDRLTAGDDDDANVNKDDDADENDDADDDADVKGAPEWAKNSVHKAVYKGYINRFNSETQCQRAYAFALIARELMVKNDIDESDLDELLKDYTNPFTDLEDGEQFAGIEDEIGVSFEVLYKYMLWLHQENIIKGWNGNLNPNGALKRAEAAVLLDQVAGYFDKDSDDEGDLEDEDDNGTDDKNIDESDDEDADKDKDKDNEDTEDQEDDTEE